MQDAMAPGAPRLHEFGNVLRHVHLMHGDPGGAEADVWVEGYYETAMQDQAALAPRPGWPFRPKMAASTSTSQRNGSTSTANKSLPASAYPKIR